MLQYSFGLDAIAKKIDDAVRKTIAAGYRTRDIASPDCKLVGTAEMGAAICENLELSRALRIGIARPRKNK